MDNLIALFYVIRRRYTVFARIPTRWKSISFKKRKVALFVFENEKIPELWLSSLRSCEAVIVPSFFNKKSLDNCGVDNVYVIPHSIDSSVWNNSLTMPRSDNGNEIKVITIGTMEKKEKLETNDISDV